MARPISRRLIPLAMAAAGIALTGSALQAEEVAPAPAEALETGRALFNRTGCGQCHTLADAGASGSYAPSLDGNPHLTRELALDRLSNGQGDMPSFAGILSNAEIATLAAYVAQAAEPAGQPGEAPSAD